MEYLDILNEEGIPTGKTLERDIVHAQGLWHRTIHLWLLSEKQELLIQKRSLKKYSYPGKWDISCAGHISAGDSSIETVKKECLEELGINIPLNKVQKLFTVKNSIDLNPGIDSEFSDVYLYQTNDLNIKDFVIDENETSELRWLPWKELKKYILAKNKDFIPHPEEYQKLFELFEKGYFL